MKYLVFFAIAGVGSCVLLTITLFIVKGIILVAGVQNVVAWPLWKKVVFTGLALGMSTCILKLIISVIVKKVYGYHKQS